MFDEGHQLKNSESKKYKDLMQVRAEWRLLLTGTPLQNNLQELVVRPSSSLLSPIVLVVGRLTLPPLLPLARSLLQSLLSFILPDQFRDANESLRAIFKVQPGSATNLLSRERITRAKKMMTPFVLRRKKAQVLKDLPSKTERIEYCAMTDLQREVYEEAIQRSRRALVNAEDDELEAQASEDEDAPGTGGEEADNVDKKPKPRGRPKKVAAPSTKMGNKADTTSSAHVLTDLRKVRSLSPPSPLAAPRTSTDGLLHRLAGLEPPDAVPPPVRREDAAAHVARLPQGGGVPRPQQGPHLRGHGGHDRL